MTEQQRAIGIVVKTYPKLSETFILEELLGLEREGLKLHLFSLQQPTDDRVNSETHDVDAPVSYPGRLAGMLRDHLRVAGQRPFRYFRTLLRGGLSNEAGWWSSFIHGGWLAAEVLRHQIPHLHVHFLSQPASMTEVAAQLAGVPFSASGHAKDIYLTDETELVRKLESAKFTVTCTQHNHDYLQGLAPAADVQCVHHGVVLDRFRPAEPTGPTPVVLSVGRLRDKKGFDLLVAAAKQLVVSGLNIEVRIAGYGPEREALELQIHELGLTDHVHLLGKLTRDEVIDQYAQATVVVQASRIVENGDRDGIPNVLLEAMAMELPVVTTAISGIPELVTDGHNGILVEPESPKAIATAVTRILADQEWARSMGRHGRATVTRRFTADQSASTIAQRLRQPRVGYVVKGYPRLSELFIATEIYRVERLGLPLRLFVLKQPDEETQHEIVSQTLVSAEHLPAMTSLSKRPAWRWFAENFPAHSGALVRVAFRSPVGFSRAISDASAQAWRARKGRWPRKLYLKEFFQAAIIADQVLADDAIDHLHAHFSHGSTTVTWFAASMSQRTFSFTAHAKDIYLENLNPAGLLARKLRATEFVATCTDANRRHLIGVEPTAQVHTIYHGLNEEFTQLLADQAGNERSFVFNHRLNLLAVGRLVEKKGLDILVEACASLRDDGCDVQLRIVGEEGDQSEPLRTLVRSLKLEDRVEFLGGMNQRELLAEYKKADAFVLPCRVLDDGDRDGIPNVLVEAMAAGLPVVSTGISGIPELITNRENGLLVTPENADDLAKTLVELHRDPELRRRLSAAGQETVRNNFDGWQTTRELTRLLETCVTQ